MFYENLCLFFLLKTVFSLKTIISFLYLYKGSLTSVSNMILLFQQSKFSFTFLTVCAEPLNPDSDDDADEEPVM